MNISSGSAGPAFSTSSKRMEFLLPTCGRQRRKNGSMLEKLLTQVEVLEEVAEDYKIGKLSE